MNKKPLIILSLICILNPTSNLYALQIKNIIDNETTNAKISSIDVTRIFVQGDRIRSVKGLKGVYTRENDEKNGEIYIQPSPPYQDRAFTILIDTEQGRHFTLLLNPTASPSETLMLIPKGVGRERAARFEQASSYDLTLNHLVRAMKNGEIPDGYSFREVNRKITYQLGKDFTIKLKSIYDGLNLSGEVYEVTNKHSMPIKLDEREFYKNGTRAISLDMIEVPPKATINLYRVVSHD